jgi:hypothetical protein
MAADLAERRKSKGVTIEAARRELKNNPNMFATMMLARGMADGIVSGACHTTADTMRPALQVRHYPNTSCVFFVGFGWFTLCGFVFILRHLIFIFVILDFDEIKSKAMHSPIRCESFCECSLCGLCIFVGEQVIKCAPGVKLVSSVFFMLLEDGVKVFGDCAIMESPDSAELATIAQASALTATAFGINPRIAMLSYATGDSNTGPMIAKVNPLPHCPTQTFSRARTHTHTHARTRARTYTHARACTRTDRHIKIRTHTHTHTKIWILPHSCLLHAQAQVKAMLNPNILPNTLVRSALLRVRGDS